MASAVDSRLAYARLSAVATASRLPTATRGSNNSYTTSWDTTYTPEQIISMLREAEVALAQGQSIGQACRTLGVSEQSYYRWRKEYGGLRTDQAKRLKDLEKENGRLRKAISDLTLDKLILKEALEGNC